MEWGKGDVEHLVGGKPHRESTVCGFPMGGSGVGAPRSGNQWGGSSPQRISGERGGVDAGQAPCEVSVYGAAVSYGEQ